MLKSVEFFKNFVSIFISFINYIFIFYFIGHKGVLRFFLNDYY